MDLCKRITYNACYFLIANSKYWLDLPGWVGCCWCVRPGRACPGWVCTDIRAAQTAHRCPSHSSPISGHLRPLWQTLTLSAESHIPGAAWLCLMNFLEKERRGYLGGHPNVSDIHQTSLQRKRLKLENGKKVVILGGFQASRGTEWGRGEQNKQTVLTRRRLIANGFEIWQAGSACLHVVKSSRLIHHRCLNISP